MINKIIKIVIIYFMIILPCNAKLSLGTSFFYTKSNDSNYKYIDSWDQLKLNSLNIGYNIKLKNIVIGLSSNRFLNKAIKRKVKYKNQEFNTTLKVRYDLLQFGYKFDRYLPYLFIANTRIDKTLGRDISINNFYSYGLGINYFLQDNFSVGLASIFPNEEIEGALGLTFNLYI